jgi:hypothetical protein
VFLYASSPLELRQIRKNTEFDYEKKIGYDKYGQRVYIKYGNDTETEYNRTGAGCRLGHEEQSGRAGAGHELHI